MVWEFLFASTAAVLGVIAGSNFKKRKIAKNK
ncbi:hypothetical protein EDC18_101345 [Natranaerovirga pectinivora]|uniref:Uncharacterized protein n=1 Tax=Natranaerovirga pectinivora TaxID=682400 RepID=A0A4V2V0N6_9FIRM|nr:hypothetical protein EDC18_101345 [Natranaerovirga pectinivora]